MPQIVKSKFFCKTTFSSGSGGRVIPDNWKPRFIQGTWYDGEYETWYESKKVTQEEYYKMNNGWHKYWVIDENGNKEEISRSYMNMIFELNIIEIREQKINDILKHK